MSLITLRVIEGADRGRVFADLTSPVTIGREEGNSIQLNDERVSRFHLKIQEDHEKLVLTDLESTNGTKVNGENTQLRILRHGDIINIGRSSLVFGTREQIASRAQKLSGEHSGIRSGSKGSISNSGYVEESAAQGSWLSGSEVEELPFLPDRLSPAQAAQLTEVLDYIHNRLRKLISDVEIEKKSRNVVLDTAQWQDLVDLQARVCEYLRKIGHPDD